MPFSLHHIAQAWHLPAPPPPLAEQVVAHLVTDSRQVVFPATSLFFALPGPRRSGSDFVAAAYQRGVRFFVVDEVPTVAQQGEPFEGSTHFFVVPDVLKALQDLAALHRQQFDYPVLGITGSNGKTMVKEWLYQLLQADYRIVRSPRSYNSQIGVPLSVWQMDAQHNLALVEAGISQTGEMQKLAQVMAPTMGIFTGLGPAHDAGFNSSEQKLTEKLQLFATAKTWVVAADGLPDFAPPAGVQLFTWGKAEASSKSVASIVSTPSSSTPPTQRSILSATPSHQHLHWLSSRALDGGQELVLRFQENEFSIWIPFADEVSARNALTCLLTLLVLGLPLATIKERMKELTALDMRMQLRKAVRQCFVLNDGYSNDWVGLQEALKFLHAQAGPSPLTVILSDFPELQAGEQDPYANVVQLLQEKQVKKLFAIGPQWQAWLGQHPAMSKGAAFGVGQVAALGAGVGAMTAKEQSNLSGMAISSFLSKDHFLKAIRHSDFNQEYILVKGARSFGLDAIAHWLEEQAHQTVLEINLSALTRNLKKFQAQLPVHTQLMVMVKAQSYGSGAAEIARRLEQNGVNYLAVAYADEGVALRQAGVSLPILVMSPDAPSFPALLEHQLEPEIFSWEILNAFHAFLQAEGIQHFPLHLKVNTGMNRLGFAPNDATALAQFLVAQSAFALRSVFSHLAASENPDHDGFTRQQIQTLQNFGATVAAVLPYSFLLHIANTAAMARHPQASLDMVRLGIGLYGIDPSKSLGPSLETVASLKTTIAQVRDLEPTETVGYGRAGKLSRPSRIATVRLGYADGYGRVFGLGKGAMWVHGKLAPVVGQVCMDMTMIDVTDIPQAAAGDTVEVFGTHLGLEQLAQWAGTIPYEIMTGISQRVKRVYVEE